MIIPSAKDYEKIQGKIGFFDSIGENVCQGTCMGNCCNPRVSNICQGTCMGNCPNPRVSSICQNTCMGQCNILFREETAEQERFVR